MFGNAKRKRGLARNRKPRRLQLESLESRRLMAVYTVTSTRGTGDGSLRQAITAANQSFGHDTITFDLDLAATISVNTPLPEITEQVTIDAPFFDLDRFADQISIDVGGNDFRPLTISSSAHAVTIRNLELTGGDLQTQTGTDRFGGGLYNSGTDTVLENVNIVSNVAHQGGGVYNNGTLTMISSVVSDNVARSDSLRSIGGGVFNEGGTITVDRTTISDNVAIGLAVGAEGGGFAMRDGVAAITDTSIHANQVEGDGFTLRGGGISASRELNSGASEIPELQISSTSIYDNTAIGDGGGVYANDVDTLVINSTIADNKSTTGLGGGVHLVAPTPSYLTAPTLSQVFMHSTITGNTASDAGGVYADSVGLATFSFSVIAENVDHQGDASDVQGDTFSLQTFIGEREGDPMLGPLQNNGGPAWTRVPLENSPWLIQFLRQSLTSYSINMEKIAPSMATATNLAGLIRAPLSSCLRPTCLAKSSWTLMATEFAIRTKRGSTFGQFN